MNPPREALVYTETTVHVPSEQYSAEAPYQVAILEWQSAGGTTERLTARIRATAPGERVHIGDRVSFVETRNGLPYFRKA